MTDVVEALGNKGMAEIRGEDWRAAIETWTAYEKAAPDAVWGPLWRGYAKGKLEGLAAEFAILQDTRLKRLDPVVITHRLTELHLERFDADAALDEFKILLELGKTDSAELDRLAHWYVRVKLGRPGMPPSLFSLDEVILARVRYAP